MKNKIVSKPLLVLAGLVAIGAGVGVSAVVSAQTAANSTAAPTTKNMMDKRGPGVMGTVSSVNGTTILVAGKDSVTYTVNATSAKFVKAIEGAKPADATIVDIKVGDTVAVRGTVLGTTVTATDVMDGVFGRGMGHGGPGMMKGSKGTVSAINGNTVTATFTDVSNIKVGDAVVALRATTTKQ